MSNQSSHLFFCVDMSMTNHVYRKYSSITINLKYYLRYLEYLVVVVVVVVHLNIEYCTLHIAHCKCNHHLNPLLPTCGFHYFFLYFAIYYYNNNEKVYHNDVNHF